MSAAPHSSSGARGRVLAQMRGGAQAKTRALEEPLDRDGPWAHAPTVQRRIRAFRTVQGTMPPERGAVVEPFARVAASRNDVVLAVSHRRGVTLGRLTVEGPDNGVALCGTGVLTVLISRLERLRDYLVEREAR